MAGADDGPPAPSGPPAVTAAVRHRPRVRLPHRDYLLFQGPLSAAHTLGDPSYPSFSQSLNLFWPADQAWCVASEIDLACTLVGGFESLVAALLADSRLKAWRVAPSDPVTFDSDHLNM